jgi:hypothetical protein
MIPGHVRFWLEHPEAPPAEEPDDCPPEPFLRLGVNGETVILTRRHVERIHAVLGDWLGSLR